jgi:putative acetyltransferase
MSDDLLIRRERPDQPEVSALLGELDAYLATLYPPEANHILDVADLCVPGIDFLVARRDGAAVGTAALRAMPGEPATAGAAYGEVKRMWVAPGERGRGTGRRLLAAVEDAARERGLRWAMLETGRDQAEAVRLYERAGYHRRPAFAGYPDNGLSAFYAKAL